MFIESINPTRPCKIFLFPIGKSLADGKDVYEGTHRAWKIAERYQDVSEYEFAVGLEKGISKGSYKIKKWYPDGDRCAFDGVEIPDFTGFSWYKQIDNGYYRFGNPLIVEFDGNGKYRLIRPNKNQWLDC